MNALLIIAKEGYQDHELEGTRNGLLDAGYEIILASTELGTCTGKFGGREEASVALQEVDVSKFDKIAFIGGPGAFALADNKEAHRIALEVFASGKPLGAICIAPTILAKAGVLKGKKATVADTEGEQQKLLEEVGAIYTGDPVTVDGQVVTANGPHAAEEFGKIFATLDT